LPGPFSSSLDPVRTDGENSQVRITDLLLELHSLLDGIFVLLIHSPSEVGTVIPVAFAIQLELRFHVRNLLDTYENFHL
jgi:hypothetical protein